MSISNQKYYLDLRSGTRAPVTVHISQGDVGRKITFSLLDDGQPFNLTSESVSVHGTRRDGANFGPFVCSYSGNAVAFNTQATMSALEGSAIAEIVITNSSGQKIGTANFGILVEKSTFPNGLSYDTDPSVYEDILTYVGQIESSSNSKITNVNTSLTNKINTVDTTLNNKITNHEATVANQISTFESEVNNTVSHIIAQAGTDNTEIVNARMVFNGTSKSTLKLRLDQFLEYDKAGTTDGIGTIKSLQEEISKTVIAWLNTHPANLVYAKDGTISFYIIEDTEDING